MLPSIYHARTALSRTEKQIQIATNEAASADRVAREAWNEVDILRAGAEALRQQINFDESVLASVHLKERGTIKIDVDEVIAAVMQETEVSQEIVDPAVRAHADLVQAGYDPEMSTAQEAAYYASLANGALSFIASLVSLSVVKFSRPQPVAI